MHYQHFNVIHKPSKKLLTIKSVNSFFNTYTGWPRINGTVDTVDFQDFALINN